ncbi:MAG: nucleotidyltransferase family protein [Streptosporangiaceae bacterium]
MAGVLLAAGEGSRLGRPKALVELAGQTLAERGVRLLQAGGADPILIVTGAVPVTPVTPVESGQIRMVHNERWRTGMGSSLCAALLALSETGLSETGLSETGLSEVGAAVVALADQPLVGAAAVARLIAAYRDGASVAVAAYDGRPRNPVLLAREHWPEILATATGDQGARAFLRSRADLVTLIECGDTGRPDDIDTAEDLERVARLASEHSASENSASENNASENSGQGREPRIVREKRT